MGKMMTKMKRDGGTNLIGASEGPSVDAVVRGVETAFGEPNDISGLEGAGADGLEITMPIESLSGDLRARRTSV